MKENPMAYVKILDLQNEIDANLLTAILLEKNIPHAIHTRHDTAYDGLYQTIIGWGWLEAPASEGEKIAEIYNDIARERISSEPVEEDDEAGEPDEPAEETGKNGRLGLFLIGIFVALLILGVILAAATGWLGGKPQRHQNRTEGVRTELSLPRIPAAFQG
jgi:hypothetical protein